jgi:DHA1 family inner membrane transport protein
MMTEVAGFSSGAVTWLLVLFGAGLFAGNLLGGKAADRKLMPSLYVILAALALVLVAFVFTAHAKVPAAIAIALFGAAGFARVFPGLRPGPGAPPPGTPARGWARRCRPA